jgi:hypothetical protein
MKKFTTFDTSAMKKVEVFEMADGKTIKDEKEAKTYAAKLKMAADVEALVCEFYYRGIELKDIVEALIERKDDLRKVFSGRN